jgi:hypothetical protein
MSEAYTTFPGAQPSYQTEKPKGHIKRFLDHGAHHGKQFFNWALSFLIFLTASGAAGAYIWNENFAIPEQKKIISAYRQELARHSFKIMIEELKRIDPNEYKNLATELAICTDGAIQSNVEADMLDVCMHEYYRRKAKVKIANAGES